ncbi:MAG: N-acetylmuramoyl-L-alanine amidase [Sphingomonas bacterium]|nr:N-acetylmuramoyl-L-alanine amidase [Sphingomonas bacterium]
MAITRKNAILTLAMLAFVGLLIFAWKTLRPRSVASPNGPVLVGEARSGGLTIALPAAVADVRIRAARTPGRPIVLIDPGHGGRDPGATGVSGSVTEKQLTLAMATELADLLERRGRVRVALAREGDSYLTLDQRAAIARRVGASLFVSLHMDSAPNPLARGATLYSLSDVASSAEAGRFASAENRAGEALSSEADGSLRSILSDLALRGQMEQSAELARRAVRRAAGRVALRPRPHQFAAFHVLRRADTPALLVEAGYISNVEDEALLVTTAGRAPLVLVLAQAIEADLAARRLR